MKSRLFFPLVFLVIIVIVYLFLKPFTQVFPEIDFRIVQILTKTTENNFQKIEQDISIPIENSLKGLKGIKLITSKSIPGLSHITVHKKEDAPTDLFKTIDKRIKQLKLPDNIEMDVKELNSIDTPLMGVAITKTKEQSETLGEICKKLQNQIQSKSSNRSRIKCKKGKPRVNGLDAKILEVIPLSGKDQISLYHLIKKELNQIVEPYGLVFMNPTAKSLEYYLKDFLLFIVYFLI